MNADQRDELDAIRREQRELQTRLLALEGRLERFGQRAEDTAREIAVAALPTVTTPAPAVVPPPLPVAPSVPTVPLVTADAPSPVSLSQIHRQAAAPTPPSMPAAPPGVPRESLEMQIGTTWLVRAGAVLVLTSLAFLGSYLYHHLVPILGPAAKVALLYLGAGALTGVGAWLERRPFSGKNEALKNYARIVFAAGLAAVYYVTYSAHWNPHLRVVANPLLAGALLLGWTAVMVSLANRRGSELLATFSILLAFYTSAVNEIGSFTLVANLFLAGGAVFLLRRQLWQIFPYVSLLATFGSYGFWRFSHAYIEGGALAGDAPHLALTSTGFWVESGFLFVYWLLFTWAVFTTDERVLPTWRRAGFVTLNNSAFFLLTTWLLLAVYPGSFWKLALGFGVVLLVLAETSRRLARLTDPRTEEAYLLQGILLVTLGFIGYFSGWQLALVLAVQSAVLLWRAGERTSRLLLGMACAVAGVSLGYALGRTGHLDPARLWTVGLAEGVLLIGNAWWSQRLLERSRVGEPGPFGKALVQVPAWFAFLGSASWFWTINQAVAVEGERVPFLVGAALLLSVSVYALRVRALPWMAQGFLSCAVLFWLAAQSDWTSRPWQPPVWNTLAVLIGALALGHWWQWRRTAEGALRSTTWAPAVWDALLAVVTLGVWLHPHAPWGDAGWMAEAALLSLAVLGYGLLTRYFALAAAGQILLLVSVVRFSARLGFFEPAEVPVGGERWLALSPLLAILVTLALARRLTFAQRFGPARFTPVLTVYEAVATALLITWIGNYVPLAFRFASYSTAGAAVFALGCVCRERRWIIFSVVPTVAASLVFVFANVAERRHWSVLFGALLLAGQQQFGKRTLKDNASAWFPAKAQGTLMTAAVFCLWAFVTARMASWQGSAFTLAASWSIFAPLVFAAGLFLRERVYRWLGLLILAATLGHIILFDVSQLDSLGRAVSSFALGLVVLGMGFVYNRYQAKFRNLL